jgi:hypothetical protein
MLMLDAARTRDRTEVQRRVVSAREVLSVLHFWANGMRYQNMSQIWKVWIF